MPRVSIMLMAYNRAEMLKEAIEGYLCQTFEDFELIVLDDCSTDHTAEVVMSYRDPRLLYLRNSVNRGIIGNSGHVWWRGAGEFIKVANDDDIAHPTLLEREIEAMDAHPAAMVVCCNMRAMDEKGRITQRRMDTGLKDRVFKKGDYIQAYMEERFIAYWPGYLFRVNDAYWDIVNEPMDVGNLGDILALGRSNLYGEIVYLADPLIDYRIHGGQDTFSADVTSSDIRLHETLWNKCVEHKIKKPILSIVRSLVRHKILAALNEGHTPIKLLQNLAAEEAKHPCAYSLPVNPDGWTKPYAGKRVAILGSFLNAYLLLKDCQASGVEVACFLDDNIFRQGKTLGGLPIYPLAWLRHNTVEMVFLSNERRPPEMVKQRLKRFTQVPLIHWRDV